NVGTPLADTDVLTPDEVTKIVAAVTAYNDVITQAAAARNIPVADIKGLFDRIAAGQEFVGPLTISGAFVTGGAFSLDGFHMTDLGYTLFADEYIKAINIAWRRDIAPSTSPRTRAQTPPGSYSDSMSSQRHTATTLFT